MEDEAARGRAVAWALKVTENTTLAPGPYERDLLALFIQGKLSLEQVIELLEEEKQLAT